MVCHSQPHLFVFFVAVSDAFQRALDGLSDDKLRLSVPSQQQCTESEQQSAQLSEVLRQLEAEEASLIAEEKALVNDLLFF